MLSISGGHEVADRVAGHSLDLAVPVPSWTYPLALEARVMSAVAGAMVTPVAPAPRSNLSRRIDAAQLVLDGREPIDSDTLMPIGPEALVPPTMRGR